MKKTFLYLMLCCLLASPAWVFGAEIYVSTKGNDAWPGTKKKPVATLARAQELWRDAGQNAKNGDETHVFLSSGDWYLTETLVLDATDRRIPLTIQAYPGAKPRLHGSLPVEMEKVSAKDGVQTFQGTLDKELASKIPVPGQVFVNGRQLIRARYPDFDPKNPLYGGFLYVAGGSVAGGLSGSVGCIHNVGDSLTYEVLIPENEAGEYSVWMRYASSNPSIGDMGPRTSLRLNDGEPVPLSGLTDTGSWNVSRWACCAKLTFPTGKSRLTWTNQKGGGLNIGGLLIAKNPQFTPTEAVQEDPQGQPTHLIPADSYVACVGKQLQITQSGSKDAIRCNPGELKAEWANPEIELKIFQSGSCRAFLEVVKVRSVDEQTCVVRLEGPECHAQLAKGDRYWLENSPDFLNRPNEWYLDRKTGILNVLSDSPVERVNISVLGTLFRVEPVAEKELASPLTFEGLLFCETANSREDGCAAYNMGTRGVLELQETTGVTVKSCHFRNIGRYAVCATGGGGHTFEYCSIDGSGEGGFLLLKSAKNSVCNNFIRNIGLEYKHIGGVVLDGTGTDDNLISHNFIENSSRYGISIKNGGFRNVIEFNDVRNTSLETFDTGAIEVTQGNTKTLSGSVIRNNRVLNTGGYSCVGPDQPRFMSWGIYLDSFAGGYLVENNYVSGSSHGGFMLQGGKGNTVRNNIFLDGDEVQGHFSNYIQNSENLVFEHNIVAFTNPETRFFSLGRELPHAITRADNNFYWCYGDAKVESFANFKTWISLGFDKNCLISDPKFANRESHDGVLRPDSPCLKSGFRPIDLSTVGPLPKKDVRK